MNPAGFLADLERKPAQLHMLADLLPSYWSHSGVAWESSSQFSTGFSLPRAVYFLGMGSSHYANAIAAARLRAAGVTAIAEIASSDLLPALPANALVFAVSASGSSRETIAAVEHMRQTVTTGVTYVALTNAAEGASNPLADLCDVHLRMHAGTEDGGVACRSFQHTLALLLSAPPLVAKNFAVTAEVVAKAAEASADLLNRRDEWLGIVTRIVLGPDGTHIAAPARRLSSALQAALMLREGPRLSAIGCESGDWSHVDVYLTKNTDYRLLLFGGSRWEDELVRWMSERGRTIVEVGTSEHPEAMYSLRYAHDEDDDVRLLTETLVVELLAASAWLAA